MNVRLRTDLDSTPDQNLMAPHTMNSAGWLPDMPRKGVKESEALLTLLTEILVYVLILCMFIPETVALMIEMEGMKIDGLKVTPAFAVSILLFPLLVGMTKLRWVWPDLVALALFGCFFISTLLNGTPERAIEATGRVLLISAVPYLAGRFMIADIARFKRVLRLLITLLAFGGVFALFESVFRLNVHSMVWDFPYLPHKDRRLGLTRAHGWTSHAIMFGIVNAAFVPVILIVLKERLSIIGGLPLIKLGALLLGTFLSLSTGAWGPALLSVLLVVWDYYAPFNRKWLWPATFLLVVGGYCLLEFASNRPLMRILMMNLHISDSGAWHYRWLLYQRVYSAMAGRWWLGHGMEVPAEFAGWQFSVDNNFLVVLTRYGRIGLIMWIGMSFAVLLYAGRAVWMNPRPTRMVRLARAFSFSLVGIILTQFSVALFSTPESLYWMMMGLIIGATLKCRKELRVLSARRALARQQEMSERDDPGDSPTPPPIPPPALIHDRSVGS